MNPAGPLPSLSASPEFERINSAAAVATPHLVAAFFAATLFIAGLAVVSWSTEWLVARHIYELAGSQYRQKDLGLVVQKEAVRRADILPLYGSSDIDRASPYHARDLFVDAPTGFSALAVAGPGTPIFVTLQNLAALGKDLRGKKVAVSLSPPMFLMQEGLELDQRYNWNFSPLHALTLMLSRDLSSALKQRLASRILGRPALLERNRVLALTVTTVADRSPIRRPLYYALLPLASLQRRLLESQDKTLVLGRILATPQPGIGARPRPRSLDWPVLVAEATAQFRADTDDNPWGVDARWWKANGKGVESARNISNDQSFLDEMSRSNTRIDLEQLLQVLDELHAEPLILSMPFAGPFWDYLGVSVAARRQYYALVRDIVARHNARAVILDEHETDPYFFFDLNSHLSPKGWVYYDQALDAFFHDTLR